MRNRAASGLRAKPMPATATTMVKAVWHNYFFGNSVAAQLAKAAEAAQGAEAVAGVGVRVGVGVGVGVGVCEHSLYTFQLTFVPQQAPRS
jgi:hypothetical protein